MKQIPPIRGIDPGLVKILEPMRQSIEQLSRPIGVDDIRQVVLQVVRGSGVLEEAPGQKPDLQPFFDGLADLTRKAQEQTAGLQDRIAVNADMAYDALGQSERNLEDITDLSSDLADQADDLAQQAMDLLDLATDVTLLQTTVGDLSTDFIATSTLLDATVSRVDATEDTVDVITAAITSLQAELVDTTAFDPGILWQFEGSLDGWTSNFTLATGEYFLSVPDDAGTYIRSPSAIAIDGRLYTRIIARIRRTGGSGWLGRASYATSGGSAHGIDTTNFHLTLATEPVFAGGGWVIVVWDMEMLSAGGSDWVDNIIDQIQLELSDDSSTTFDVDWVAIGRVAPSFFSGSLSALTSRVTATEDAITALSSDVTSLESRATDLEGDVDAVSTAVDTLSTRVDSTEDSISTQSSQITSLSSRVDDAEDNISSTSTALSALTTRVTSAEGVNTSQSASITTLSSGLSDANSAIVTNATAIVGLDTRVTSAENINTSQSSAITSLQNTVNDGTTGVAATASALSNLTTRVTNTESVNTSQATSISSLNSGLTNANTAITANSSAITTLQTSVNSISGNLTLTSQQVSLLSVRLNDGESIINSLTTAGNNKDWDVPSLGILPSTEIASATIGGRTRVAARIRTSGSIQQISRFIEVDPSSIYEVRVSIVKNLAHGYMYFGLAASTDGVTFDNSPCTPIQNRAVIGGAFTNPYWFAAGGPIGQNTSNFAANQWYDLTFYIAGSAAPLNRIPNGSVNGVVLPSVPPGLTPDSLISAFQLAPSARFFNLRVLNFYNSIQTDFFYNNVSVRRVFGRDAGIDQEIADRQAAISTEQTARINGDNTLAQSITSVSTTVNGNTSSINTLTTSVNGLNSQFVLQLNSNGRITGLKLAGSASFTSAVFQVDQFSIALPGPGTPVVPFTVGVVNGVSTVGINGNLVVDGTIVTRTLLDQSVTTPKMAAQSVNRATLAQGGSLGIPTNFEIAVIGCNIITITSGSTVILDWAISISHNVNNDPAGKLTVRLYRAISGSGLLLLKQYTLNSRNFLGEVYPAFVRREVIQGVGAGNNVGYQVNILNQSNDSGFVVGESTMFLKEEMR